MSEEVLMDLSKFEIEGVRINLNISLEAKDNQALDLVYSGSGESLDDVVDGCRGAIASLCGCLEAREII